MRLIDADALTIDHFEIKTASNEVRSYISKEQIDCAPTVDTEPVVRCGECVYRRRCMLRHYFAESNAVDSTKIDWSEWYCAEGVREERYADT